MRTHAHSEQPASLPEALANINSRVLDDRMLKRILNPEIFTAFERRPILSRRALIAEGREATLRPGSP